MYYEMDVEGLVGIFWWFQIGFVGKEKKLLDMVYRLLLNVLKRKKIE